jgi:predicted RNase H-like HicB family nuclease
MKKKPKVVLHNLIEKEGNLYAAICLELNVASQGKTAEEAIENLKEAVELFLETVYEDGEEDQFIPRPASEEDWIRYFQTEVKVLQEGLRPNKKPVVEFENRIFK